MLHDPQLSQQAVLISKQGSYFLHLNNQFLSVSDAKVQNYWSSLQFFHILEDKVAGKACKEFVTPYIGGRVELPTDTSIALKEMNYHRKLAGVFLLLLFYISNG